jgi:hypothetical protein
MIAFSYSNYLMKFMLVLIIVLINQMQMQMHSTSFVDENELQTATTSMRTTTSIVNGYKNYTEMHLGNVNILISIPHDGWLRPTHITDRVDVLGNLKRDLNTRRFGLTLSEELGSLFLSKTGTTALPFVVMNNLHR